MVNKLKVCRFCKQPIEKCPNLNRHRQRAIECQRKYYSANKDRVCEASRASSKKYRDTHRVEISERRKVHSLKLDPLKLRARELLSYAVRSGKLVRPKKCQKCLKKHYVQAHHEDYSKPLDVIWLCISCHGKVHRKIREGKG